MEIKMQNVAHLYVGCEVKCSYPFHPEKNSINSDGKPILSASLLADFHEGVFSINDFKLCLRRLSSITGADAVEIFDEMYPLEKDNSPLYKYSSVRLMFDAQSIQYLIIPHLLKRGFWIFGDEHFESGKIIEKTT